MPWPDKMEKLPHGFTSAFLFITHRTFVLMLFYPATPVRSFFRLTHRWNFPRLLYCLPYDKNPD